MTATGRDALRAELDDFKVRLSKLENAKAKSSPGLPSSSAFNFYGELIGSAKGTIPPTNIPAESETTHGSSPDPVAWSTVTPGQDLSFDGARLQLPTDGLWFIRVTAAPHWTRVRGRASPLGTVVSIIPGGNFLGAVLAGGSISDIVTQQIVGPHVEAAGSTVFGVGNAISLGAFSLWLQNDPEFVFPSVVDITAEIHRLIEG